jgi:hypothetical protein
MDDEFEFKANEKEMKLMAIFMGQICKEGMVYTIQRAKNNESFLIKLSKDF